MEVHFVSLPANLERKSLKAQWIFIANQQIFNFAKLQALLKEISISETKKIEKWKWRCHAYVFPKFSRTAIPKLCYYIWCLQY